MHPSLLSLFPKLVVKAKCGESFPDSCGFKSSSDLLFCWRSNRNRLKNNRYVKITENLRTKTTVRGQPICLGAGGQKHPNLSRGLTLHEHISEVQNARARSPLLSFSLPSAVIRKFLMMKTKSLVKCIYYHCVLCQLSGTRGQFIS